MVTVVWYYGIDSQTYKLGDAGLIYEIADEDGAVLTYTRAGTLPRKSRDYVSGRCDLISGQLGPTYRYDLGGYDGFIQAGNEGFESSRTVETITRYAEQDVRFLLSQGVEAILIACGTVSTNCLPALKRSFHLPIVGVIDTGCRAALEASKRTLRWPSGSISVNWPFNSPQTSLTPALQECPGRTVATNSPSPSSLVRRSSIFVPVSALLT